MGQIRREGFPERARRAYARSSRASAKILDDDDDRLRA